MAQRAREGKCPTTGVLGGGKSRGKGRLMQVSMNGDTGQ